MPKKIAFIGAGSFVFTRNLVRDLFTFPAFHDAEIALMDIDAERLSLIKSVCEKIRDAFAIPARITATLDRKEALRDADGVVCTVFNGGIDIWRLDLEIPKKYGVDINVGDTRSVSGIFRALRNIPLMLEICRDIEECCPRALFINYTNPMAILCGAMQKYTRVNVTGLCHSVQGTAAMLAEWLGVPNEELDYLCAGVNHQAFYLRLEHRGRDLYPALREKLGEQEYFDKEQVRNEMCLRLGYYVTESSGHNSEYNAWFRKRPDLIEKYCTHGTNWNPGEYAYSVKLRTSSVRDWRREYGDWLREGEVDKTRSNEYAASIFNATFGDETPFVFNGNVINDGCIPNLPHDACVEIPVYATRMGMQKMYVGPLPDHLAILVNTTSRIESLTVEAAMEKSRDKVYHAVCMDPLCSAVLSLGEIKKMVDELFEANRDYLGDYT